MKYCPNCNAQLADNAVFCTSCGTSLQAAQQPQQAQYQQPQQAQYQQYQQPQQAAPYGYPAAAPAPVAADPFDHTAEFDPEDISENKVFAMLCYLMGIAGVLIALLGHVDSKYVGFHIRQALRITVVQALLALCCIIPFLGWIFAGIMFLVLEVIVIICFVQVCKGEAKEAAVIRSIKFLK